MNAPAIRTSNLTKAFGDNVAVNRLDLEIKEGELFCLVGPDGAGKTTTMRLLAAIMDPTDGDAWVAGRSVVSEAELVKEEIGYMPQRFGLYEDLTVIENMNFYADLREVPAGARPERFERLLGFSKLAPFRKRLAGNLSGGMKQKLGLACALVHSPKVLLLDEPTNGVDPVSRREFWKILWGLLKEGVTILISTAYLDEAERSTRVALMHRGSVLAMDEPGALKKGYPYPMFEVMAGRALTGPIKGLGPVKGVSAYGDKLHVSIETGSEESAMDGIRRLGVDSSGIRRITPSLEDIFISMVEKDGR